MKRSRIDLLLLQRDHSWEKEEWFPPLSVALEGVSAREASWKPPGGGNTIRQIVRHINYYNERLLDRLAGKSPKYDNSNDATFGEPGEDEDESGWRATLEQTRRIAEELRKAMAALSDDDLDNTLSSATIGEQLALWMTHDAYHTGQIVLIRKQQGTWPANRA
ncbi:DinB family protein [Paenibacillus thermoaerophilus]|uniref:DinB family protein n=1 Tax=Paenibacillus thermoaerophilus TaxID=1215385 RepID=A0ABW2V3L2_9BACL|nr:DinB family protein [Paenibacillus thermoaerophilus]TMV17182.1 DinB family protein [Paenibacillus thermoaerophilus]